MRRILAFSAALMLLMVFATNASALCREECGEPRGRFTNLGFAYSHLNQEGYPKLHSDVGFSLSKGTTYHLHRPIAGFLRFGIDAAWFDITYDNYKVKEISIYGTDEYSIHHVDLGLQVGPSVPVSSSSYGIIGLGIESRFGQSKMNSYFQNDDFYDSDEWTDAISSRKVKTKFSGLRAYISFRF